MDLMKTEIANAETADQEAVRPSMVELVDLQLSLVGGGMGDVIQ